MEINLDKAVEIVKKGGIIIYPTDTAFGIGCRIDNPFSVDKLFAIRKRPEDKAVPVLFDSIERISEYVLPLDPRVKELMRKYWPGALTIVLKCKTDRVNHKLRGGGESLGVRIPANNLILELIKEVGAPIVGTSANFSGEKTPFKLKDLDPELARLTDGFLSGETKERNTSTVIDCTGPDWKILRLGAVKINL